MLSSESSSKLSFFFIVQKKMVKVLFIKRAFSLHIEVEKKL